jgi:hypothetical protein
MVHLQNGHRVECFPDPETPLDTQFRIGRIAMIATEIDITITFAGED